MKVYEYGTENERTFAMFQCAAEPWWVFEASAKEIARDYHVYLFEKHHFSPKTIYNVFWSANNYSMPNPVKSVDTRIEYWYGEEEKRARKRDLAYTRKVYPQTVAKQFAGLAHAELVLMFPERFYREVMRFLREE